MLGYNKNMILPLARTAINERSSNVIGMKEEP
jgi:hypothetical protein